MYETRFARADTSRLIEWWRTIDFLPLFAAAALLAIGLVLSLASGPAAAARIGYSDPFYLVWRHVIFAVLAAFVLVGMSMLSPVWARRVGILLFIVGILLLTVLPFIGHEVKGAKRWLRLGGMSLQPVEIVKPGLVIMTAWLLAQRTHYNRGPWIGLALGCFIVTVALLFIQPDIGQMVLISAAFLVVFFVSGLPLLWGLRLGISGLIAAVIIYATVPHVRHRIGAFLDPAAHDTYQSDMARAALVRGGHLGVGPGEGQIKSNLPDAHTDFIYAVAGEEYGLIMGLFILSLYALATISGVWRCAARHDDCARAAGVGLFTLFGLQAAINIGVNIGALPAKGMSLPLISYGGSSLVGTAMTLGLGLALAGGRGTQSVPSIWR